MRPILASTLLLSSILLPAAANARTPDDASAPTPSLRVSTGVIAPILTDTISIQLPNGLPSEFIPAGAEVGLLFTVDTKGQPQDIKVVKPVNPYWDARVVEAVRKSHFRPGMLDGQAIPVDMNVTVSLK
jgi:TonB family protein